MKKASVYAHFSEVDKNLNPLYLDFLLVKPHPLADLMSHGFPQFYSFSGSNPREVGIR